MVWFNFQTYLLYSFNNFFSVLGLKRKSITSFPVRVTDKIYMGMKMTMCDNTTKKSGEQNNWHSKVAQLFMRNNQGSKNMSCASGNSKQTQDRKTYIKKHNTQNRNIKQTQKMSNATQKQETQCKSVTAETRLKVSNVWIWRNIQMKWAMYNCTVVGNNASYAESMTT